MIARELFIAKAEEISNEGPSYRHGGDGSDGTCDCIGLIIGAIRRAGGQWRGLHGSNYAARCEVENLQTIAGSSELERGEVVFKAYEPGQGGYDLPDKYEKGGAFYDGDLRDYYHVGIVESTYPLRIRHMTAPKPKMDTSLGKWGYHGRLKKINYNGGGSNVETVTISGGNPNLPVNMRQAASTGSNLIAQISQGSTAELLEESGAWDKIKWQNITGYVMSIFVQKNADPGEMITVSKSELETAYDILGDLLGLRG